MTERRTEITVKNAHTLADFVHKDTDGPIDELHAVIDMLADAALVGQKDQPVEDWEVFTFLECIRDDKTAPNHWRKQAAALHTRFANNSAPHQPTQEPVAWIVRGSKGTIRFWGNDQFTANRFCDKRRGERAEPLYTRLQPAQKLMVEILDEERRKFQLETLRTSALSVLLKKWIKRHEAEHSIGSWSHDCDLCIESRTLLETPVNIEPIPPEVYYSLENNNFYFFDSEKSKGLGQNFYDKWISRSSEFPKHNEVELQCSATPKISLAKRAVNELKLRHLMAELERQFASGPQTQEPVAEIEGDVQGAPLLTWKQGGCWRLPIGTKLYTAPQPAPQENRQTPDASVTASASGLSAMGRMTDEMRGFIEGMSVSVDVSTGEFDEGRRYFGTVTEVMDDRHDKHGVTLLVQDAKPNWHQEPSDSIRAIADEYDDLIRHMDAGGDFFAFQVARSQKDAP